jgi:hypothetical protein
VPNEYIKADQIVEAATLLLQRQIVLHRLFWRQPDAAFVGSPPPFANPSIAAGSPATMASISAKCGCAA